MKKMARMYLDKAVSSLLIAIEHFNRPWDRGRIDSTLIFLDHAFEMLLKAAILVRNGRIQEPRAKETIGFAKCVRIAVSDDSVRFLSNEQALTLQVINCLRDAAQHDVLDISEQHLYFHAQVGLTLFRDIFQGVFGLDLRSELPERVLPISTIPPTEIASFFEREVEEIKALLKPKRRRHVEACSRLRALSIFENATNGNHSRPSKAELERICETVQTGKAWSELFPGVASIAFTAKGYGPSLDLRIKNKEGIPIQLVKEGTPDATIVAVKRVDELSFYSLSATELAGKVGLTPPKLTAMVRYLKLEDDADCFKAVTIGKSKFRRFSPKAISQIKTEMEKVSIDEVWKKFKPTPHKRRSPNG